MMLLEVYMRKEIGVRVLWIGICVLLFASCLAISETPPNESDLSGSAKMLHTEQVIDLNQANQESDSLVEDRPTRSSDETNFEKQLAQFKQEMCEKMAYQIQCNEKAIYSVNTSIAGASLALYIFTAVITIGGVILGVYITFLERKVRSLTDESKSLVDANRQIEKTVKELHTEIISDISKLYNDLKKQETKELVNRLIQVPEDVSNLFPILAARDMPTELFADMKKAYQSLKEGTAERAEHGVHYFMLFFQHFPGATMFDADLESDIESNYYNLMASSFRKDILKTSREFIEGCIKRGLLNYRDKIKKYYTSLFQSKHRTYTELHIEIYNILPTKEDKFNLYDILQSEPTLKTITVIYGQRLLSEYKDSPGNTESQKLILTQFAAESKEGPKS